MPDFNREYPLFSACGLNCGLCPRYHTQGASKCPGCAGEGFAAKHPPCGVLSCCLRHGIEYCCQCTEYPCKRYDGADASDSFITHKNQLSDFEKARAIGMEAYARELDGKVEALEYLLANADDGRRKSLFCTAVNLLPPEDVRRVAEWVSQSAKPDTLRKETAAAAASLLEEIARERGISLKLRKKPKPL